MSETRDEQNVVCKNCGEPVHWSLGLRRWEHEHPRVRYCIANFTPEHNPTTEAEPVHIAGGTDG